MELTITHLIIFVAGCFVWLAFTLLDAIGRSGRK